MDLGASSFYKRSIISAQNGLNAYKHCRDGVKFFQTKGLAFSGFSELCKQRSKMSQPQLNPNSTTTQLKLTNRKLGLK